VLTVFRGPDGTLTGLWRDAVLNWSSILLFLGMPESLRLQRAAADGRHLGLAGGMACFGPSSNSLISRERDRGARRHIGGVAIDTELARVRAAVAGPLFASSAATRPIGGVGSDGDRGLSAFGLLGANRSRRPRHEGARPRRERPSRTGLRRSWGGAAAVPVSLAQGRADLKLRVIVSMALLIAAKSIAVTVPMIYKLAIDRLTPGHAALALVVVPAMLIIAYAWRASPPALRRVARRRLPQGRAAAVREVALSTFRISMRSPCASIWTPDGGLSRAIERGIRGTDSALLSAFSLVPTLSRSAMSRPFLCALYSASFAL